MTTTITTHGIHSLKVSEHQRETTFWVDLTLLGKHGFEQEFTIFFINHDLGRAFAEALKPIALKEPEEDAQGND